jgi:hypothetical protein
MSGKLDEQSGKSAGLVGKLAGKVAEFSEVAARLTGSRSSLTECPANVPECRAGNEGDWPHLDGAQGIKPYMKRTNGHSLRVIIEGLKPKLQGFYG